MVAFGHQRSYMQMRERDKERERERELMRALGLLRGAADAPALRRADDAPLPVRVLGRTWLPLSTRCAEGGIQAGSYLVTSWCLPECAIPSPTPLYMVSDKGTRARLRH